MGGNYLGEETTQGRIIREKLDKFFHKMTPSWVFWTIQGSFLTFFDIHDLN